MPTVEEAWVRGKEVGGTEPRSLLLWRRVSARSADVPLRRGEAELSGDFLPKLIGLREGGKASLSVREL